MDERIRKKNTISNRIIIEILHDNKIRIRIVVNITILSKEHRTNF